MKIFKNFAWNWLNNHYKQLELPSKLIFIYNVNKKLNKRECTILSIHETFLFDVSEDYFKAKNMLFDLDTYLI
jgi:hypothetical protein